MEPTEPSVAGDGAAPPLDGLPRRPLFGPLGVPGSLTALVFAWQSFTPGLMPRTWVSQAVVTGLCLALGYAIGTLGAYVWRRLGIRVVVPDRVRAAAVPIVLGGVAAVVVLGLLLWPRGQNLQRELLDMAPIGYASAVPMLATAAVVAVVLGLFGRLVGRGVTRLNRWLHRHLPPALAAPATIILVLLIGGYLVRDVALDRFVTWANTAYGYADTGTEEGVSAPTGDLVSGGAGSLAPWDTLGFQGRSFVAGATTTDELGRFHGDAEVVDPIRVYAGTRSAGSIVAQADLAVAELERTGAFEREVLAVVTVTGTGWVDPDAARALEMLHAGDTAMVGVQYSYLPSWISTFVDDGKAVEAGAVLFDAVHARWDDLPEDDRPRLVVFGISLGSYGAEGAFASPDPRSSVGNMVARTDGVLLAGPTNDNTVWRQLTAARDDGSPVWRPVVVGGDVVRFANGEADLLDVDDGWESPRVLYVQHPSDPVVFWGMDWLWSKPEWMDQPRGADVPVRGAWFPVVTWVQGIFDLMAGFGAPPGHGHDYRLAFGGAWSQVAPPEGWTSADTARLSAFLNGG